MDANKSDRQRNFKKGIDMDMARRRREETTVELRKSKRDEQIQKRRMGAQGGWKPEEVMSGGIQPVRDAMAPSTLDELAQLVASVNTDDSNKQFDATTQFRKLLSIERNPPIQQVIEAGVVPRLVQFLGNDQHAALQFEAAWALTNIASGTSQHTKAVIDAGAVPIFVYLLESPHDDVKEQAVWALGNISGDSPECRNFVLSHGILNPLIELCQRTDSKLSLLRNATWTLSNLCRGKPQPPFDLVRPALPVLAHLLNSDDDEIITDTCWALSYLSDDTNSDNEKIQAVIRSGVVRRLVELLHHHSHMVKTPALRTIGNIVTGDDVQTQVVVNRGGLTGLLSLLSSDKKSIVKEACWTISNITAGNSDQIEQVINANLIPPLVAKLRTAEYDIKKESAWAISNATVFVLAQLNFSKACIAPLCDLFTCSDPKMVVVAMEGIENILRVGKKDMMGTGSDVNPFAVFVEECEGLDKLERLQNHPNKDIYKKALQILRSYFDTDELETGLEPEAQMGQFAFGGQNVPSSGFQFS